MTRNPSARDSVGARCGNSSGTLAWRKASLISIVSRGNLRGRISAGIPRAAAFPASSAARTASGTAGSKSQGKAINATRAPRSSGPKANDGNTSGPALTSVRGARHPERDEPAPAGRQIAGGGEQLDLRRCKVDRDGVAGDRAVRAPERAPEVVARPHLDGRAALPEPERGAVDHNGNLHTPAERA